MYGSSSSSGGGGGFGRALHKMKSDNDLMIAIKKATSPDETSPKQKHVRTCIVYTWDHKTSTPFWAGLKNSPFLAIEVQCFKALITVHKVVCQGHPTTLPEAITEVSWLRVLPRMLIAGFGGYSDLIVAYVEFLTTKLEFHRVHPNFTGTFDYDEYVSLRGTADPNEGYETIFELMALQDHLDRFQRMIFASIRASPIVECRLAALVPLIEESYGIYRFCTSMLRAMHRRVGSLEALEPLRNRYNSQHFMLRDFYNEGRRHRYLTSLIVIPQLSDQPPSLYDVDELPKLPSRPPTPPSALNTGDNDDDGYDETESVWNQYNQSQQQQQQAADDLRRELEAQYAQQLEHARQLQDQYQQMLNEAQMRMQQLQEQLARAKAQYEHDQQVLQQYDAKVRELQMQLAAAGNQSGEVVKALQDEVAQWKAKYEALAKLYAQLRKEHLELLQKYKDLSARTHSTAADAEQLNRLQAQLNAKNLQLAEIIAQRDEFKRRAEMQRMDSEELAQLREAAERARRELDQLRHEKEEEILVLQTGMDQSLIALNEMKRRLEEGDGLQVAELERSHAQRLDRILDAILAACVQKVQQASMELESAVHPGNVTATPAYTLSMLEETTQSGSHFSQAFLSYLVGGDQSSAITSANAFAYVFAALLNNCKGVTHMVEDEQEPVAEAIVGAGKEAATVVARMFQSLTSTQLGNIDSSQRPNHVSQHAQAVAGALSKLGSAMEKLAKMTAIDGGALARARAGEDLGDVVANEMQAASRAIEEATARLQALLSTPNQGLADSTLKVHTSILSAAMALMQAIGNLIRCATLAQQEIAAHGKGSTGGSAAAFYKKHHRWTEGLISAAKAIGQATTVLVETADGVVTGTKSMEQLVVAANEVAAATAQLVAASRVKAVDGSRTQAQLEAAAASVTTATRLLVKAAKDAARQDAESNALRDFSKLSMHDLKTQEMEQQVRILTLEKELVTARGTLAQMRKASYQVLE